MLAVLVALLVAPATATAAEHWVSAWAASPSDASPTTPELSEQTLRMIIHPTFGGTRVRIRLSNRFGDAPVSLGAVKIARRAAGAAVAADSNKPVTFRGQRTVQIGRGAEVVSDPVDLRFSAFDDLAVSVYVSGTVQQPTEHFVTRQTSYRSPEGSGDQTGDANGSELAPIKGSFSNGWFFLSELDVVAPEATHTLVAFGDSITDGFQGNGSPIVENSADMDANARWPDYLARRLAAAGRADLAIANESISGNAVLQDRYPLPFGASGLDRLDADGLAVPAASDMIVLEGINDLGADSATAEQVISGLAEIVQRAHAAGLRVHLATLTPSSGSSGGYGTAATNTEREKVNAWIRTSSGADSVIDFDAVVRDPADHSRLKPDYDSSDHLHPNGAGYRAMAAAIDLATLGAPPVTDATSPSAEAPTGTAPAAAPPSATTCTKRRAITVRLPRRYRAQLRSATVRYQGRRLATIRRGRASARVAVRGLPAGRVTLRLVIRLRDGRTVKRSVRYRTCTVSRAVPGSPRSRSMRSRG